MQTFNVQGMTCEHCRRAIEQAIIEADAGAHVEVDLGKGEVRVHSRLQPAEVVGLITEQGYTASPRTS